MRAQEKFWLYVILGSELGTLGSPRSAAGEEVRRLEAEAQRWVRWRVEHGVADIAAARGRDIAHCVCTVDSAHNATATPDH